MIFLIYTILVILQQYNGMTADVPDPCPSNIKDSAIVADMCKSSFATEHPDHSGSYVVDSVALRIMIQQENCICRVTIDNQIELLSIGLRKFDGLTSSAPVESECGLAVDINYIPDMSTRNVIASIECIDNVDFRSISFYQSTVLQFKSRIINGNLTRGYCMMIQRDVNSDHSQVLRIDCDAPVTTDQIIDQTAEQTTIYSSTTETSTTTSLQTTDSIQSTTMRTKEDTIANDQITGNDPAVYIVVSASSSTVAIILLVVLVITCIRNKSNQSENRTNENVDHSNQSEPDIHYCALTNNVQNVPGHEYDSIDSNYNTIEVDRSQPSNNIVCMEGDYISVEPNGHLTTNIN